MKRPSRDVMWTVYHTVLAVELALVVIIQLSYVIHVW